MATVFDSVSIKGLRATHFEQLLNYVLDNEETGTYYGNKEQYQKRHEDVKKWLEEIVDTARSAGTVIPK